METPEPRDTQQDKAGKSATQRQQVGQQDFNIIENPIRHESTGKDNGTVNQKDAPIRQ
jgi:hypothetical protein